MRRLVGVGCAALALSLFLPAIGGPVSWSGLDVLVQGPWRALEQVRAPASPRAAAVAVLSLVALLANVALPALAVRPGRWQRAVAFGFATLCIALVLYLAAASPLRFEPGALVWLTGVVALAFAAAPQ